MNKAFCIWCETGEILGNKNYFWIHTACANELMDLKDHLQNIETILQEKHKKNLLQPELTALQVVEDYIKDVKDFDRRWKGSMALIKSIREPEKEVLK